GYFVRSFSNSFKNFSFNTLINVPFIPSDLESITPALSNFLSAFTMTERVIPTRSATFDATNNPSVPSNSSKICSIASSSLNDNELIAIWTTALLLASISISSAFLCKISILTTFIPYYVTINYYSLNLYISLININILLL